MRSNFLMVERFETSSSCPGWGRHLSLGERWVQQVSRKYRQGRKAGMCFGELCTRRGSYMRLQHPPLLRRAASRRKEDALPPRYRHCHSRLATRRTRFPLSSKISTGTQPKTKTSQERLKAAIFRVLGRSLVAAQSSGARPA
jgi:hypothetical protein